MLEAPSCLHIPNLYEKRDALLSWETVDGATGYRLECVFDEDFESASHGVTWSNINAMGTTWNDIAASNLTWDGIGQLSARGLSWNDIMFSGLSWNQIAEKEITLNDLQTLPARFVIFDGDEEKIPGPDMGWTWDDLKNSEMTWDSIMKAGVTWRDISFLPPKSARGLSWDCIKARQYTWNDITERGLTFDEWKNQTDARVHIAHTVKIPIGKKTAYYRVQAHNGTENSEYMPSLPIIIIPVYYREGSIEFSVVKGRKYTVQLCIRGINRFQDIGMTLEYASSRLKLNELSLQAPTGHTKNRNMPVQLDKGLDHGGTLVFTCHRSNHTATKLSTVIAEAAFTATDTGDASVRIY